MNMSYRHECSGRSCREASRLYWFSRTPVAGFAVCLAVWLAVSISAPLPTQAAAVELVVSVAASLTDVATEVKPLFEAAHPGIRLSFNFGSSGSLGEQIERGAPVDVFIAAAEAPVNQLVRQGLIDESSVRHLAVNRLVLIRPLRSPTVTANDWNDLGSEQIRRVAIGNPEHVPAGEYAKRTLEFLGLWDRVVPKLVLGEDVRQVLQYVRLGAVEAGIVYATDAASAPDVALVAEAPGGSHPPIVYPIAPLRTSRHRDGAEAFVRFMFSEEARNILSRYGFDPAE